ncbi:MAG: cytochrome c biogenesis protein CcdA [Anaerolineae bacterium]|nr:cytochrome c biogenesis protein CcdA [Anaerolineae bacterium]
MSAALAFAFSAGLLASVNPCGFAMLPTFISYYLNMENPDRQVELNERLLRALWCGFLVTLGFLTSFVLVGMVFSISGRALIGLTPALGLGVGIGLIGLGVWTLLGRTIPIALPLPQKDLRKRSAYGMFLYGVAYAGVSLNCTLPIFLSVLAGALAEDHWSQQGALFIAYGLGMGTVITTLALATALFQNTVVRHIRQAISYVKPMGAVVLILAGAYLIYYQVVQNPLSGL